VQFVIVTVIVTVTKKNQIDPDRILEQTRWIVTVTCHVTTGMGKQSRKAVHSVRLCRPHAAFTYHFSEESPSRLHSSSNMNDSWPQIIHTGPDRQRDRRQRLSIGSRFARAPNLDVTWLSSTVRRCSRVWNTAFSHIFSL